MTEDNKRTITMSLDVYDRFVRGFYPISAHPTIPKGTGVSKLCIENGELPITIVPGSGHIQIKGEITEKELVQIASFF